MLQSGPIDRGAGEPAVVISLGQAYPALVPLAVGESLAGLALRLQGIELLFESLLGRLAGVDRTLVAGLVIGRLGGQAKRGCSPGHAKEPRARPMRPGDPLGNYRQRPMTLALVLERVLANEDGVGVSAPLTHQCGACLQHGTGIEEQSAFLQVSGQALQAPPQPEARATKGVLLQLVGKGSDHQIATEAQRGCGAMQFPPSKPQLVRRPIDQPGNFVCDLCDAWVSRSAVPGDASTENRRRLARMLASRSVGGWGFHTLAG